MIIQNSNLALRSQHTQLIQHEKKESLIEGFVKDRAAFTADNLINGGVVVNEETETRLQHETRLTAVRNHFLEGQNEGLPDSLPEVPEPETEVITLKPNVQALRQNDLTPDDILELDPLNQTRLALLEQLLEALTGKKIHLQTPAELMAKLRGQQVAPEVTPETADGNGNSTAPQYGLHYQYHETYIEEEQTSFNATGTIVTEDGQEIQVNLQLNLSRSFRETVHIDIRQGAATDPLVVNFAAGSAQLTERNFQFDLDIDGTPDQIAFTQSGSGFLALDKNNDGIINNGRELFGPTTNEGFSELAAYDEDSNGFIDEGDSAFHRLRIWTRDSIGNSQLLTLGEVGIGALYLGHIETPFTLKDAQNNSLGEVRTTGMFLRDNGSVGTLQQIDLVT